MQQWWWAVIFHLLSLFQQRFSLKTINSNIFDNDQYYAQQYLINWSLLTYAIRLYHTVPLSGANRIYPKRTAFIFFCFVANSLVPPSLVLFSLFFFFFLSLCCRCSVGAVALTDTSHMYSTNIRNRKQQISNNYRAHMRTVSTNKTKCTENKTPVNMIGIYLQCRHIQ